MQNLKSEFPVLDECIYANTAASGLMYKSLIDWRHGHDLDFLNGGGKMKKYAMQYVIPETRKTVADFFNCKYKNVALIQNFSIGLNMLLEGLDKSTEVLLLKNDYPSVNWPFESRGFPISYANIDSDLENNILKKLESGNINVLALSLVQWLNGVKIDTNFLKKLKETYPDLIIIADGTQYCGTESFDFENSGIDILGSSGYKWLLAGYGNGFMLFKDHVKERFTLRTTGFNAANLDLAARDSFRFAKHFEPGHLDTFNFGSLKFSLDFLTKIGMEKIEEHNNILSLKAKEEFTALGLLSSDVVKRKNHSTIYNIKGDARLFEQLSSKNVRCAQRGEGIRFSFHFYNTKSEIDRIVGILKTML